MYFVLQIHLTIFKLPPPKSSISTCDFGKENPRFHIADSLPISQTLVANVWRLSHQLSAIPLPLLAPDPDLDLGDQKRVAGTSEQVIAMCCLKRISS